MIANENKIAIPKDPFPITQSASWGLIANTGDLALVAGTGDDLVINENLNRMYRVINQQNLIIKDLLNQLRIGGYDK